MSSPEDYARIESAGSPAFSADGRTLFFGNVSNDADAAAAPDATFCACTKGQGAALTADQYWSAFNQVAEKLAEDIIQ